ncbi:MAG: hypothetical protein R3F14_03710 [Polyangiaceae bacterium]
MLPRPAIQGFRSLETGVVIAPGMGSARLSSGVILRCSRGQPLPRPPSRLIAPARSPAAASRAGRRHLHPRLPTARMTADHLPLPRPSATPPAPAPKGQAPAISPRPPAPPRARRGPTTPPLDSVSRLALRAA